MFKKNIMNLSLKLNLVDIGNRDTVEKEGIANSVTKTIIKETTILTILEAIVSSKTIVNSSKKDNVIITIIVINKGQKQE